MMEWNAKTPFQWDWENLVMFNGKEIEIPKQIQSTEWGINNESLYLSGDVGGSGSDLGNGSSSKSSISASVNSSSNLGTKVSKSNFEAVNGFAKEVSEEKELGRVEDNGTSPRLRASVGCNESLIGLKLGKRTYFEDVCTGSTIKPSSFSVIHTSSISTTKRSRASYQSTESSICQVEGCKLDLTSAKDYHRRHRVCESHSKCPKVIVAGRERRFCQQCSRFHDLVEFDEKKRSCRRRLSDHNARRRKPQPEAVQLNSTRLTSSFYDTRQQMSLVLDRVPLVHTRPTANPTWESTCDFKHAQEKGSSMKPAKAGGIGRQVHFPINDLPNAISMLHHNSNRLFPFKGTTAEVLNQGLEAPLTASNLDATSGLQRALSLLSNSTAWGSGEPDLTSLNQIMHVNHVVHPIEPPVMQMVSQGYPFTLSEYCQAKQQEAESRVHSLTFENNSSNQFQESQLFKAPYDSGFYANQQN